MKTVGARDTRGRSGSRTSLATGSWLLGSLALALVMLAAPLQAAQAQPAPPPIQFIPADPSNYSSRRGRQITHVVIHTVEGSKVGCIAWFRNPASNVSAHYVVGLDGSVVQMVDDQDKAWHCGRYNSRAIGIEHEGWAHRNTWTPRQIDESARLTAWIVFRHNIPVDRQHIIGHVEVPGATHTDPGPYFDWTDYMNRVRGYLGQSAPPPPPPPVAGPPALPQHSGRFVRAHMPTTMTAGQTAIVWLEYENLGLATWTPGRTRVGTDEPRDRSSDFYTAGNWPGPNRATGVDHGTSPGSVGRFTWILTAPNVSSTTVYQETFRLVEELVTWFPTNTRQTFRIEVQPRSAPTASAPPPPPPSAPAASAPPPPPAPSASAPPPPPASAPPPPPAPSASAPPPPPAPAASAPPPPPPTFAVVDVVSRPAGASIHRDGGPGYAGSFLGRAGDTANPFGLQLSNGRHRLRLRLSFHEDVLVSVTVTAGVANPATLDASLRFGVAETWGHGISVKAGGASYQAPAGAAAPFAVDWDRDGTVDLLVGRADGGIDLLENRSSRGFDLAAPRALIGPRAPLSVGASAVPCALDWNGDGRLDLVVGNEAGEVFLFPGTGTPTSPAFDATVLRIEVAGQPFVAAGGRASPWVIDVDGDHRKDLLVGCGDGRVRLLRNSGPDHAPVFMTAETVPLSGPATSGPVSVTALDLDRDGLPDLVVARSDGALLVARNHGSRSLPRFDRMSLRRLQWFAAGGRGEIRTPGAPALGRVLAADIDGNGQRDLVIGDQAGGLTIHFSRHLAGDLDDSKRVDGIDAVVTLRALGSRRGDSRFVPAADIDRDGDVDAVDVAIVTRQLGRSY